MYAIAPYFFTRSNGGFRADEMMRRQVIGQGAAEVMHQVMNMQADTQTSWVCSVCGRFEVERKDDGPMQCTICKGASQLTRVRHSGAFKEVAQLMQIPGQVMRVFTDPVHPNDARYHLYRDQMELQAGARQMAASHDVFEPLRQLPASDNLSILPPNADVLDMVMDQYHIRQLSDLLSSNGAGLSGSNGAGLFGSNGAGLFGSNGAGLSAASLHAS